MIKQSNLFQGLAKYDGIRLVILLGGTNGLHLLEHLVIGVLLEQGANSNPILKILIKISQSSIFQKHLVNSLFNPKEQDILMEWREVALFEIDFWDLGGVYDVRFEVFGVYSR